MNRSAYAAIFIACLVGQSYGSEYDGGGRVGDYLNWKEVDQRIEIFGICASACTIKLGARNACVHTNARILFHAARDADGRLDRLATLMMLEEYPQRVRSWVERRRALDSQSFTAMSGAEAIALGVPSCEAARDR